MAQHDDLEGLRASRTHSQARQRHQQPVQNATHGTPGCKRIMPGQRARPYFGHPHAATSGSAAHAYESTITARLGHGTRSFVLAVSDAHPFRGPVAAKVNPLAIPTAGQAPRRSNSPDGHGPGDPHPYECRDHRQQPRRPSAPALSRSAAPTGGGSLRCGCRPWGCLPSVSAERSPVAIRHLVVMLEPFPRQPR